MTKPQYTQEFEAQLYAMLGGLEFAEEFFRLHPNVRGHLQTEIKFHFEKGGAPPTAAAIFHKKYVKPFLDADFTRATGGLEDYLDGRR